MASSLIQRFFGSAPVESPRAEPKRLLTPSTALIVPEKKASSLSLLPKGAYGPNITFFSPDGGRTMIDFVDGQVALALVAYWYVATRWRAQKLAEAPLMVVKEDQTTGDEEWLPKHELVSLLDEPSVDYDMGELIEQTSHYLDNTGSAIWVKDLDNATRVGRLTAFSRNEFETKRSDDRLFDTFLVQTANGPQEFSFDQVCFFKDAQISSRGWTEGRSRLDVALAWLHLGEKSRKTIHELLNNSVWPSVAISPNADWDPDEETFKAYMQEVEKYAKPGNKGRPFVTLGGSTITQLAAQIKDLVPNDILNRVESVVSSVSGVPAIVLQYQVGMENSPWSQMKEARRMAYDDTIGPTWRKYERVLTRQLLRLVDPDESHFIRFDTTNIDALQRDQAVDVTTAVAMGRAATLNERRHLMGLEPATAKQDPDGKADEIPELTQPSMAELLAGAGASPNGKPNPNAKPDPNAKDPTSDPNADPAKEKGKATASKMARLALLRKFKAPALLIAFRNEAIPLWKIRISHLLHIDGQTIADIVDAYITDSPEQKSLETKARQKDKAMAAVSRYLNEESKSQWMKAIGPLTTQAATRGTAVVAADLNVNFNLLHPNTLAFAKKTAGKTVTGIAGTTKSLVSDIIQGGIDANATTKQIAQLIRDATGFSSTRAQLIARTETTKIFNGAPEESLAALSASTGTRFTKTWSGALDDRERDEHLEMEGETVDVGDVFSNGLDFPSEPNCRCVVLFAEGGDE